MNHNQNQNQNQIPNLKRTRLKEALIRARRLFSRRFLVFTLMVSGTAFGVGVVLAQTLPRMKSWLLVSVDQFSRDRLPVRVLPTSVDFRFLPLGITLNEVRILPNADIKAILAPLLIQELSIDLSLFQILRGDVSIKEIMVRGTKILATLPQPKTSGGKPLEGLFKELDRLPIDTIVVSEVEADISVPHAHLDFKIENLKFDLERSRRRLEIAIGIESLLVTDTSLGNGKDKARSLRLSPDATVALTPSSIDISNFEFRRGNSIITSKGRLDGDVEALEFKQGRLETHLKIDVKSVRDWIQKSFEAAKPTPPMQGLLEAELELNKSNGSSPWTAKFDLTTKDYRVEGILLDAIKLAGTWDGEHLIVPKASSVSRAGRLEIEDLRIGEGAEKTPEGRTPWLMRLGKLKAAMELHEFIEDMGLGPIPVWLSADGEFPCESQLVPKFILRCGGHFNGQNMVVQKELKHGRTARGSIVAIPTFTSKGNFTFDLDKFTYDAEIAMPNSVGRSVSESTFSTSNPS